MTKPSRKIDELFGLILLMAFLSIVLIPELFFQLSFLPNTSSLTENRSLTGLPDFSLDSISVFPKKYEKYYNDNFSFRDIFIRLNSGFSAKTYGISAIPDVLIGKSGWLYYVAKSQGNSLEDYKGLISMDKRSLELIRENLEQRTKVLKANGIKFLVVVAPDKQTIYPENLPDNAKRERRYPTRLDQIIEYLNKNSTVQILDVREALRQEKNKSILPLYMKTDSHWNDWGGFIAYQKIMETLSIEAQSREDFEWSNRNEGRGDLANMLALNENITEPNMIQVTGSFETDISFQNDEKDYGYKERNKRLIAINKNKDLPKLLFFHDSFGAALFKFLGGHFRESIFIHSDSFSTPIIDQEKPNVVILEVVERYAPVLARGEME